MTTTEKGLGWEIKRSIHLIILMMFPFINCFVYFLMNKKVKQKKWKIMGWVFLLLQILWLSVFIFANSFIGTADNYGSSPKLEDYLGSNYYAKYGSDYKTRPEYEQYLKDLEEWEETPDSVQEQNEVSKSFLSKEDIMMYATLSFIILYFTIIITTCIQRDKYLKLLRAKEEEEDKISNGLQSVEGEVTNMTENKAESEVEQKKAELLMRWFEFIIYIQLFVNMFFNLVNAANFFSGNIYGRQGIEAATVYSMYPKLSMIDKLCGVMYLALAVLAIIVRQRLAKYKKDGPNLYLLFIIVQVFVLGSYNVALYLIVQSGNFAPVIGQILGLVILFVANKVYFEKRKYLFKN